METVLMVREPSSVAAAEAYEGLRKQVVNAVSERLTHLSQLVQLDAALRHGAERDALEKLTDSWFEQASLARIDDANHPERDVLFELVSDHGGLFEVLEPAYVDTLTGRVIRPGRARRAPVPAPTPAVDEPAPEPIGRHTVPAVDGAAEAGAA